MTPADEAAVLPAPRGRPAAPRPDPAVRDADLIRASVQDPERFGEVYRRHRAEVLGFVASRIGSELAADVAADTFVTAFRIRERFTPLRDSARPWLLGIAVREIARRRRAERSRYRMLASLPPVPPTEGPAEQSAALALTGPVARALLRLRAADRDVLLLMAWADLTYQEVADALGVPIGTVRSRLHRARRVLRATLPDIRDSYEEES
jgi:RNA polymerase sigma-70 factor (ECF subfamily)